MAEEWGPLGALIGEWEGEGGLDVAYSHARGEVHSTPFLEKGSFKPFGPVENGRQVLYGLDYRTAMWRGDEENPFHTEVGYWLWDSATDEVMKGFVVPRGIVVLAGGRASAGAQSYTLHAARGEAKYAIGENAYLAENASTLSYDVTISVNDDGSWSYEETTMLDMREFDEPFPHRDHNTLYKVA